VFARKSVRVSWCPGSAQEYIGCPTRYRTRHFFNNFTTNEQLGTLWTHTTDTFLFISHTTNVLLFKFRCNIFIGVGIIKEMPGSVASETHCSIREHFSYKTVLQSIVSCENVILTSDKKYRRYKLMVTCYKFSVGRK